MDKKSFARAAAERAPEWKKQLQDLRSKLPPGAKTASARKVMSMVSGERMTKTQAGYVDQAESVQKCLSCEHYQDRRCEIVAGQISPSGTCKHFSTKLRGPENEAPKESKPHIPEIERGGGVTSQG